VSISPWNTIGTSVIPAATTSKPSPAGRSSNILPNAPKIPHKAAISIGTSRSTLIPKISSIAKPGPINPPPTPRITFKNIEQLAAYMNRPEMLHQGKPRRIILSEQGFHSPDTDEGQLLQAAAYAYAYQKIRKLNAIDSFILHRHVDHGQEGGLNLGLWTRHKPGKHPAEPAEKKKIYEVFKAADTPSWEEAFRFALPVIGLKSWSELQPPQ
jgi:hypothetical protein